MNLLQKVTRAPSARHAAGPLVLVLIGLAAAGNAYSIHLATAAAIAFILTAAFNLVYGYAGIFNLSIIMTYGLGAFTSVYLSAQLGVSFWVAVPASMLLTAAISVLVALPSRGLDELFLAIQTLAFALAMGEVLLHWDEFSGGTIGIYAIDPPTFFGIDLVGGFAEYYWLAALGAWFAFDLVLRIDRSGMGRALVALREGPRVLASVGVSPETTRLVAFGLSGMLAGLAGGLYAHFQLVIDLDTFSFARLIALLLATILGGAGYFTGPIFGVLAILVMDELSLATSQAQDLVYGLGILLLVAVTSGGIAGALRRGAARLRGRTRQAEGELTGGDRPVRPELELAAPAAPVPTRRIEVSHVGVAFGGTRAVDDVSVSFATGEVVGLIGPNGAGKTTLLNAITGDVPVSAGTIDLSGTDLRGLSSAEIVRRGVGRTFQSPKVIRELTLVENVMLAGDAVAGTNWAQQVLHTPASVRADRRSRARALALLDEFALAGRAEHFAGDQPYGVLRLVEIARNLMLDPAFLLLDEPGAGLTEFEREEIAAAVRAMSARGLGVVLVDHNMPLITAACDRVVVLDTGRVIADGAPGEVLARRDVIAAYLGVAL
ncbi:ATP-binding cassette domain-containing protein [Pseudonocardia petroleophila]|uniref:ATP-binding cassette domain-containing protein n=1 Tax=Pseudonocardia petroleophila TaxID=37331 RepID=A0A7G7MCH2_9PSEU|nr:ATP-binding cassette domain-containing protein [Pseudonocardia petroleophila]QNG50483.1 ATP-binding cassette domain-containing protein [Pseudonocardia petroleophila]